MSETRLKLGNFVSADSRGPAVPSRSEEDPPGQMRTFD